MAYANYCPYHVNQRMRFLRPLARASVVEHMELNFGYSVTLSFADGTTRQIDLDYLQLRPDGSIQIWVNMEPLRPSQTEPIQLVALSLEPTRNPRIYELLATVNEHLRRPQWKPQ